MPRRFKLSACYKVAEYRAISTVGVRISTGWGAHENLFHCAASPSVYVSWGANTIYQREIVPGRKSACRKFHHIGNDSVSPHRASFVLKDAPARMVRPAITL